MMKAVRTLFRILVGLVFVFSSTVKGIDPLGTVYRMDDYFIAFGMPWAMTFSLVLTIFLCTLEFITGISLLFNLYIKGVSWILLLMMTYFTVLTFFDAFYNLVPDCGCFGDAIKLTNMQTFLKNIILMGLVIPIFIWRNKYKPLVSVRLQILLLVFFTAVFSAASVYCLRHLPFIDFMQWKKGSALTQSSDQPVKFYVTYKNTTTGETKEFLAPNYPWNDSVWMSQWVFVSQRTADEGAGGAIVLHIEDETGADQTAALTAIPDYSLIAVAYDLSKSEKKAFAELEQLYRAASDNGYAFMILTSSLPEEVNAFKAEMNLDMPFYFADDVVLKMLVRSNPGLLLIHRGLVKDKWAWRDLPGYGDLNERYFARPNN